MSSFTHVSESEGSNGQWKLSGKKVHFQDDTENTSLVASPERELAESRVPSRFNTLSANAQELFDDSAEATSDEGLVPAVVARTDTNNNSQIGNSPNRRSPKKKKGKQKNSPGPSMNDEGWSELDSHTPSLSVGEAAATASGEITLSTLKAEAYKFLNSTNLAFILLFVVVLVSLFDNHLQLLYRGHAGLNDIIRMRGFTGQTLPAQKSLELARNTVKSTHIVRNATANLAWESSLGYGHPKKGSKHLQFSILSPKENAIIGEENDILAMRVKGMALSGAYYQQLQTMRPSLGEVPPTHVNVTLKIALNGRLLKFQRTITNSEVVGKEGTSDTYEIALEKVMNVNIPLSDHNIQKGVHLIEATVIIHNSQYTGVPDSMALTSVGFFYMGDLRAVEKASTAGNIVKVPRDWPAPLPVTLKSVEGLTAITGDSSLEEPIRMHQTSSEFQIDTSKSIEIVTPTNGEILGDPQNFTLHAKVKKSQVLTEPPAQIVLILNTKRYDITQNVLDQLPHDSDEDYASFHVNLDGLQAQTEHTLQLSLTNFNFEEGEEDIITLTPEIHVYAIV